MNNTIDLTAKLLATENITVRRCNAHTASFDVKSRILSIPVWKDMTFEIESMFISHEVGHALFTVGQEWLDAIDAESTPTRKQLLKGYINVIEDARIEKLMKRRYPGIRKTFFEGYSQLTKRDFFQLNGKDVNAMHFIDRINLYFKGASDAIVFSDTEQVYIDRINSMESILQVIELAKELIELAEEQQQEESQDQSKSQEQSEDYEDDEGSSGTSSEEVEAVTESNSNELIDDGAKTRASAEDIEDLMSETDKILNDKLNSLVDSKTIYRYLTLNTSEVHDVIVPFKQILKDTDKYSVYLDDRTSFDFEKFMAESERVVSYLTKEFEMRKSAAAYKRAQISKSGSLNMNKLHAYKISDDIFKRVMSIPQGKNHGMIFLLDWSGSMRDSIEDTIKQVINLSLFCKRINIPFEVYAFTNSYIEYGYSETDPTAITRRKIMESDEAQMFSHSKYSLLNIFSSKMSKVEFNTAARRFTNMNIIRTPGFALGSTPLNQSLIKMMSVIPKFKKENSIEKLTLITLTDGAADNIDANTLLSHNSYRYGEKYINTLIDPQSNKSYQFTNESWSITETLLRIIKDRYDITLLGFYITDTRSSSIYQLYRDHYGNDDRMPYGFITKTQSEMRSNGFTEFSNTGRDNLFVLFKEKTSVIDDVELEVDIEDSARKIAQGMTKSLNAKKVSRVLLNKFIGYVA